MFRTLGSPTFFIRLTADDMICPDLLYVLAKMAGMDISKEEVDSMSSEKNMSCCVVILSQQLDISRSDLQSL